MERLSHKIYELRQKTRYAPKVVVLALTLAGGVATAGCDQSAPKAFPQATELPTATSSGSTETPSSNTPSSKNDTPLMSGSCALGNIGDVVEGDVSINGQWTTDHDPNSGQITIMQAPGDVCAPFGADIQRGVLNQPDDGVQIIRRDIQNMQQKGCTNGCTTVLVNFWPSGNQANP